MILKSANWGYFSMFDYICLRTCSLCSFLKISHMFYIVIAWHCTYLVQIVRRCSPPYWVIGWAAAWNFQVGNCMKQWDCWITVLLILHGVARASTWRDLPWVGSDPAHVLRGYLQLYGNQPGFQIHRELPSHTSIQTFRSGWFPCWQWINTPVFLNSIWLDMIVVSSLWNTNLNK